MRGYVETAPYTPTSRHKNNNNGSELDENYAVRGIGPVSYTHLDVYKRQEWEGMLAQALIPEASLRWHPLFRLCVSRLKPQPA